MEVKTENRDNVKWIYIDGNVDINEAAKLRVYLTDARTTVVEKLVIDMEKVGYIDSSGIAVFVECMRALKEEAKILEITNPNETCGEIFKIARLDKVFNFV